jgi:hypothetical protein
MTTIVAGIGERHLESGESQSQNRDVGHPAWLYVNEFTETGHESAPGLTQTPSLIRDSLASTVRSRALKNRAL